MSRRLVQLLLLIAAGSAAAQEPALESVVVEARLIEGEPAAVSMRYRLQPRGADELHLTSVEFTEGRAINVRAFSGTRELSFESGDSAPNRLDGTVRVPPGATGDLWELRLEYEVLPEFRGLGDRRAVAIPLLVAGWPPEETRSETFRADVVLVGGGYLLSAFPASFERIDPVERTGEASAYRFELPVVPSLIRLRLREQRPLLSLESAVDLATIGVLALLSLVGWRRLRERWA